MEDNEVEINTSVDEQPTEEVTPASEDESAPLEESEEIEEMPVDQDEDASKSARAFQKMRHEIDELRQELSARERVNTMFDEIGLSTKQQSGQQTITPQQQQQIASAGFDAAQFVDDKGFVDIQKLNATINNINRSAQEAKAAAQKSIDNARKIQLQSEANAAFEKYPQLNPQGGSFDRPFHNSVRRMLTDSMLYPGDFGGRTLTFKEAADKVMEERGTLSTNTASKKSEVVSKKEQAAATVDTNQRNARRSMQVSDEEIEALRERTRRGGLSGTEAAAARIAGISKG